VSRIDGEWQDEGDRAVGKTADHDSIAHSDMALPGGAPFISLERRQQRHTLELPPLVGDNGKIGRDAKTDVRRGAGRPLGSARMSPRGRGQGDRVQADRVHLRVRVSKRRQWCRTRHCMNRRNWGADPKSLPRAIGQIS
jgi:hypothetical protein